MRVPLPVVALLAGCIAAAGAETLEPDVLTLTSGEVVVGELVDVRDGKYWVLRPDGRMTSLDFRTVRTVARGGAPIQRPVEELPLPSWRGARPEDEVAPPIQVGFDMGLNQALRLRFNTTSRAVDHVDARLGVGLVGAGGVGPLLHTGVDIALFNDAPVHLTLSGSLGTALIWGRFYPFIGVGSGIQYAPRGPFELHIGGMVGGTSSYFGFTPDVSASWVW